MIDLIYLAFNRLEFTKASMQAMIENTEWEHVRKLVIYDDGSKDGTKEFLLSVHYPVPPEFVVDPFHGPVAAMNHYISRTKDSIFAKIDNDVLLPPHWLTECLKVVEARRELDLLGIESFFGVITGQAARSYVPAKHIGGIGLMRRKAFKTLPHPNGRFGFTAWQTANKGVVKGWLNPSLPIALLDRMPMEPWASLSRAYVANGWQRNRPFYSDADSAVWAWWK